MMLDLNLLIDTHVVMQFLNQIIELHACNVTRLLITVSLLYRIYTVAHKKDPWPI